MPGLAPAVRPATARGSRCCELGRAGSCLPAPRRGRPAAACPGRAGQRGNSAWREPMIEAGGRHGDTCTGPGQDTPVPTPTGRKPLARRAVASLARGQASVERHAPRRRAPHAIRALSARMSAFPDAYDEATGTGRWRYAGRLGEGGLAVVHRAVDVTGPWGEVALKVLRGAARPVHAFELHREAQWSLTRLHDRAAPGFDSEAAQLFPRCLEDHSGFEDFRFAPGAVRAGGADAGGSAAGQRVAFEAQRRLLEAPDFDWGALGDGPTARRPYVVQELLERRSRQGIALAGSKKELVIYFASAGGGGTAKGKSKEVAANLVDIEYIGD
ncbi:unnamed protein product [Prorocentrum cordatum]|uniref:Protein kinase domain-containing protein n=1 Tax=Prorocentrum cordatum TaxID=2364126 RepID=A0ABN9WEB7_9DINO|nr:unnamed protein product [Polarella glacialis]